MVMHMYIFVRRDFKKRNNYDTIPWQTRYPMEHCNNADRQHLSPDVICHEVPVRAFCKTVAADDTSHQNLSRMGADIDDWQP